MSISKREILILMASWRVVVPVLTGGGDTYYRKKGRYETITNRLKEK
jgi:hypothetical protein